MGTPSSPPLLGYQNNVFFTEVNQHLVLMLHDILFLEAQNYNLCVMCVHKRVNNWHVNLKLPQKVIELSGALGAKNERKKV